MLKLFVVVFDLTDALLVFVGRSDVALVGTGLSALFLSLALNMGF